MLTRRRRIGRTIRTSRTVAGAVAGLLVAALLMVGPVGWPERAAAQGGCRQPVEPGEIVPQVPWSQNWLAPGHAWRLTEGADAVVAVVDTGVDTRHRQLSDGRVLPGVDLVDGGGGDGRIDCDSHGTAVASVVAAALVARVGFAGMAPEARILPVRVVERGTSTGDPDQPPVDPGTFAEGIRWAAHHGADVINTSIVFYRDHDVIAAAVREAVEAGVIVVAAVGNLHEEEGPDPTPYPAAYPDVVGVGAIDADGRRLPESSVGPYVDLVAPGHDVTVAVPGSGHARVSGTSFAAPFVSGSAALVRAAHPELPAAGVVDRLLATADPGPGSRAESGSGVVNPYRALTGRVADGEPLAAEPPASPTVDPVAQARAERWQAAVGRAVLITVVAVVLVVLAFGGRTVLRRRRALQREQRARRGAGRTRAAAPATGAATTGAPTPPGVAPAEPADPEQLFFTVPTPGGRR